ncbi:hypothetical protein MN608_05450 [Microdochium nivale]|nr:hypothetical protein MN608_05450 [Microdochium nivale]
MHASQSFCASLVPSRLGTLAGNHLDSNHLPCSPLCCWEISKHGALEQLWDSLEALFLWSPEPKILHNPVRRAPPVDSTTSHAESFAAMQPVLTDAHNFSPLHTPC